MILRKGFVYGHKNPHKFNSIIGTEGIVRMTHDFTTAVVDLHGVNQTLRVEKPFGGKNIDVLCDLFADSIEAGQRDPRLPLLRDSAIASEYAWKFLQNAHMHDLPAIGDLRTLEQIRERRKNMKNGYGLLHSNLPQITNPLKLLIIIRHFEKDFLKTGAMALAGITIAPRLYSRYEPRTRVSQ